MLHRGKRNLAFKIKQAIAQVFDVGTRLHPVRLGDAQNDTVPVDKMFLCQVLKVFDLAAIQLTCKTNINRKNPKAVRQLDRKITAALLGAKITDGALLGKHRHKARKAVVPVMIPWHGIQVRGTDFVRRSFAVRSGFIDTNKALFIVFARRAGIDFVTAQQQKSPAR
jgi:hypothetical protein